MNPRVLIPAITCFLTVSGADAVQEFELPNGLRVLLLENHERPLVRLEMRAPWNPAEEPLGGVLAEMLKTGGAGSLKREAFLRFLEDRALRFTFSLRPRAFAWSVLADSQGQDGAFESLAMALTRPELDGNVLETRREGYGKAFRERTPRMKAEERFLRRCGDPSRSLFPPEASLGRLELRDILLLARRILRPDKSVLLIQGDMNLPQAKQLAALHLGAWAASDSGSGPVVAPEITSSTRAWMVRDAGGTVQIKVGSADRPLTGARLDLCAWLVERELASSPQSLVKAQWRSFENGAWMLEARSSPGVPTSEAVGTVQKLLARLREMRVDTSGLTAARRALEMERRTRALHPEQEASFLAERALGSGARDEAAENLSVEEVQAALGTLFSPDACAYFIVGAVPRDPNWPKDAGLAPMEIIN